MTSPLLLFVQINMSCSKAKYISFTQQAATVFCLSMKPATAVEVVFFCQSQFTAASLLGERQDSKILESCLSPTLDLSRKHQRMEHWQNRLHRFSSFHDSILDMKGSLAPWLATHTFFTVSVSLDHHRASVDHRHGQKNQCGRGRKKNCMHSSYLSPIPPICLWRKKLSCGEISDFYA